MFILKEKAQDVENINRVEEADKNEGKNMKRQINQTKRSYLENHLVSREAQALSSLFLNNAEGEYTISAELTTRASKDAWRLILVCNLKDIK